MANDEVVNFDPMRDMVLNDAALIERPQYEELLDKRTNKIKTTNVVATIKSKEHFQFKWDALAKDIITQNVSRSIKSTVKENINIDGFDSKPFGWGWGDFEFYPKGDVTGFLMTVFTRSEEHPSMATIREGKGQTSSREESQHGHHGRTSQFPPSINSQCSCNCFSHHDACNRSPF